MKEPAAEKSAPETLAPAPAAAQAPKPAVKASDKKSITLTFEGDDLELHQRIQDKADEEDRTPSIELLRFVRKHFPKAAPAPQA